MKIYWDFNFYDGSELGKHDRKFSSHLVLFKYLREKKKVFFKKYFIFAYYQRGVVAKFSSIFHFIFTWRKMEKKYQPNVNYRDTIWICHCARITSLYNSPGWWGGIFCLRLWWRFVIFIFLPHWYKLRRYLEFKCTWVTSLPLSSIPESFASLNYLKPNGSHS